MTKNKVTAGDIHTNGGSNYWYYTIHYYDNDNVRHSETKSTKLKALKKNKKAAEHIRDERVHEIEQMYNLSVKDLYLHEFLKNWYDTVGKNNITQQTYESYKYPLKYALEYFEANPVLLIDVRPVTLNNFYQFLVDNTDLSPNTITKKVHMIVRKALNYACENDLIPLNPATIASNKPRCVKPEKRAATAEEVNTILEKVQDTKLFAPFWLCAKFGLRRSEAVGLRWDNVDLDEGVLKICETAIIADSKQKHVEETKNESSKRSLSIDKVCVQTFKKIRSWQQQQRMKNGCVYPDPEFVCTDEKGDVVDLKLVSSKFTSLCEELGFQGITLHSFRHFFATTLIREGANLVEISKALGHAKIDTTSDIYGHLLDEGNIEISNIMSKVVNI